MGEQVVDEQSHTIRCCHRGLRAERIGRSGRPASATDAGTYLKASYRTVQTEALADTSGATPKAGQLLCGVPVVRSNEFIRTFKCETLDASVQVIKVINGSPVLEGTAYFQIQDEMQLKITVSGVRLVGNAGGIEITPSHRASGAALSASGDMLHPFALTRGSTRSGVITYNAGSLAKGTMKLVAESHSFLAVKAGYSPGRLSWGFERTRCDNMIGGRRAGCVFPAHAPIDGLNGVSSMASIPFVNVNMKQGQAGPHHFGVPGGAPLHRITDQTKIDDNRKAACGKFPKPPNGQYGWTVIPAPPGKTNSTTPTCDEYPFASSAEGGNKYPADQKLKWVPKGSNDAQGRALNTFYGQNRILDGDPYFIYMGP